MSEPVQSYDPVVVYIAAASEDEADKLARHLVEARLAACTQHFPISSTYRWDGDIVRSGEVMIVAKTLAGKIPALEAAVLALHSYEVPEIVAVPIVAGHQPYLEWIARET